MKSTDDIGLFTALIAASAASGNVATVPATQSTAGDGTASIALGFPPETFIDRAAGGLPPRGQDMNGFLNRLSKAIQALQAGYLGAFNETFAASIGGYPSGAIVSGGSVGTFWVSTADNNTSTPGTDGATWQSLFTGLLTPSIADARYLLLSATALQTVTGPVTFKGTVATGFGAGFGGGTANGSLRWTNNPFTFGNPLGASNGAYSGNFCVSDIIGDANNDSSGVNMRGFNYEGTQFDWFFAWNGNITTPAGKMALQSWVSGNFTPQSNSFRNSATFSSSGTFTAPTGVTIIRVQVWAAGGGGGAGWLNYDAAGASAGGGGGGGGYAEGIYTVTPGQALSVTVGTGGALGTSSSNATSGGASSVGNLVTATGGQPGSNASSSSIGFGGLGGSSSGSNKFSVGGTYGSNGFNIPGGAGALGGAGGGTFNSGSTWHAQGAAASGNFPGGGGGGAGGGNVPAGSGANGFVIIQY